MKSKFIRCSRHENMGRMDVMLDGKQGKRILLSTWGEDVIGMWYTVNEGYRVWRALKVR